MKLKFLAYVLLLFVFKQTFVLSENLDISVYTGTFDVIDKEGDDQTNLIGIEHRNTELFRNTFLGIKIHSKPRNSSLSPNSLFLSDFGNIEYLFNSDDPPS